MKTKKKICKGNYRTDHFTGCGKMVYRHKYGLCLKCFRKWVNETVSGDKWLKKNLIPKAKKEIKAKEKKKLDKMRFDIISVDGYRKKYIQKVINEMIRIIDNGHPCIARPNQQGMDAGHFHSVGSNRTLSLHPHNIHIQSRDSNSFKGGDSLEYYKGLIQVYGQDYATYVDELSKIKPLHLTKLELQAIRAKLMKHRLQLRKRITEPIKADQRIKERNKIIEIIGLFKKFEKK